MKKLNNKGFSLVELIIVIAIMAILVGVVGTQVIPYLENSRQAKDMQVFSGWNTAGMSAYSQNAAYVDATANYTILVTQSGVTVTASAGNAGCDKIKATFLSLTDLAASGATNQIKGKMASRAGDGVNSVKIYIPASGNIVTTVCTGADGTGASTDFAEIENK